MTATNKAALSLGPDYALSDAQLAAFQAQGFIVLKGLLSPEEVDFYRGGHQSRGRRSV